MRPFLKWAGGKRQLLPELLARLPNQFSCYYEPFVGGGALFFQLQTPRAILADINQRLIRTYMGVRDNVEQVIERLEHYPYDSSFFYRMREINIDKRSDAEVAAWFIYLNRTGFNGLYRVNRQNRFNVPFGRYTNPTICDEIALRACSNALAGVELLVSDFEHAVAGAGVGDLVYFDPPYDPLSVTSSFTSYTSKGFGADEQIRLRDVAMKLKKRGATVLISNSSTSFIKNLYENFEIATVSATRMVNSKGNARGPIGELIIR